MYLSPSSRSLFTALGIATGVFAVALLAVWGFKLRQEKLNPPPPLPEEVTVQGVIEHIGLNTYGVKDFVLVGSGALQAQAFAGREAVVVGRPTTTLVQGFSKAPLEVISINAVARAEGEAWPYLAVRKPFPVVMQYLPSVVSPSLEPIGTKGAGIAIIIHADSGADFAVVYASQDATEIERHGLLARLDEYAVIDQQPFALQGFPYSLRRYKSNNPDLNPLLVLESAPACKKDKECPQLIAVLPTYKGQANKADDPVARPWFDRMVQSISFPPRIKGWSTLKFPVGFWILSFAYPPSWEVKSEKASIQPPAIRQEKVGEFDTTVLKDPSSTQEITFTVAKAGMIPRVPLPPEKIEEIAIGGAGKGMLYHDRDAKTGEISIDKLYLTTLDGAYEVLVQGYGPIFDAVMMSLRWEK